MIPEIVLSRLQRLTIAIRTEGVGSHGYLAQRVDFRRRHILFVITCSFTEDDSSLLCLVVVELRREGEKGLTVNDRTDIMSAERHFEQGPQTSR